VDVHLFKRRNFATAMFFSLTLGMVLYGTTVMIPQFLQVMLGYAAVTSGEALAGGGFIMICVLPIVGMLVSRIDPRKLMAFGFVCISLAMYYMSTRISLTMDFRTAFLMRVYQMFGLAFIFVPQNILAYVGVPREKNNQISSMNSFMRNVGGSIGIALITASISRIGQQRRNTLIANTTPGSAAYESLVGGLTQTLTKKGASTGDATQQAYGMISGMIDRQAMTMAYVEVISILAVVVTVAQLPFEALARRLVIEVPFLAFAVLMPIVGGSPHTYVLGISLSVPGLWGAWNILVKGTLGVAATGILVATTEVRDLLSALDRLHVPRAFTAIASFMIRYSEVIAGELRAMHTARISRGHDPRWIWQARAVAATAGTLFIRSYERG